MLISPAAVGRLVLTPAESAGILMLQKHRKNLLQDTSAVIAAINACGMLWRCLDLPPQRVWEEFEPKRALLTIIEHYSHYQPT